jgi:hypothetical protein
MDDESSRELSKLVAALPAGVPVIEALESEGPSGAPTLLGEILPANSAA